MTNHNALETLPMSDAGDALKIDRLDRIARMMDSAVGIPGTRLRVGLDSIVGLVPGVGDALAFMPAVYIIGSAWKMGVPRRVLARMATNTAIDTVVGSIPVLGDIFDVGFKSNRRNVRLLREHIDSAKIASADIPTQYRR